MSLEAAILELNTTMKALLSALSGTNALQATVEQVAATEPARRGRPRKNAEATTQTPANDAGTGVPIATETKFFQVAKHNTVYEVKVGEPLIVMDGAVEITAEQYIAERERLNKVHGIAAAAGQSSDHIGNVATVAGAQQTVAASQAMQAGNAHAPAAAPAPSPTTSAVSQATPASADFDPLFGGTPAPKMTFKEVVDTLVAVSKGTKPGQGREAVMALVKEAGAADVPSLQTKGEDAFNAVGLKAKALLAV